MKTSKISSCTFDKSFTSKFGTLYQHTITLENKDTGQINAKEEMPDWLERGKELNYEITPNGKYPDKIKKVNPKFGGNGQEEKAQQNNIELSGVIERIARLEEVVKQLVKHTGLKYVAPKPKPEPQPEPVNANDDLPF